MPRKSRTHINIFWGSSEEFLCALRDELAAAGNLDAEDTPTEDEDDEWSLGRRI